MATSLIPTEVLYINGAVPMSDKTWVVIGAQFIVMGVAAVDGGIERQQGGTQPTSRALEPSQKPDLKYT